MRGRIGGVWVTPTTATAYINGAWRTLPRAKAYIAAAWRDVASFVQPMTLALTGNYKSTSSTSGTETATPTGGLAPFTYSWAAVSSAYALTFSAQTSASTTVTTASPNPDETLTVGCTVTDSLGTTATATKDLLLNASTIGAGGTL